ncbi:hypothetical protein BR93DRAFT_191770 [Coniochaeta sp. PMI_546]|nr:hypothetical protein BR93DRAFT_191770 [Coniochaeta sp. PMI_546]
MTAALWSTYPTLRHNTSTDITRRRRRPRMEDAQPATCALYIRLFFRHIHLHSRTLAFGMARRFCLEARRCLGMLLYSAGHWCWVRLSTLRVLLYSVIFCTIGGWGGERVVKRKERYQERYVCAGAQTGPTEALLRSNSYLDVREQLQSQVDGSRVSDRRRKPGIWSWS